VTEDDLLSAACCLATLTSTVAEVAVADGISLDMSRDVGVALALGLGASLSLNVSHEFSDGLRLEAGNERRPDNDDFIVGGVNGGWLAADGESEW